MPAQMNLEHIEVPPNNKLSELDKAFAFINYPYPAASPFDSKWTIDHALAVAGVDADSKTKILQAYAQQDWVNVRYYFSLFTTSAHAASSNTAPHGVTSGNNTKPSTPADNDYRVAGYCDTDKLTPSIAPPDVSHGVTGSNNALWTPGQQVTFTFLKDTDKSLVSPSNERRKKRVRETFAVYQNYVNLKIEEVAYDPKSLALIRISFGPVPDSSSWSWVGKGSSDSRTPDDQRENGGLLETTMMFWDTHVPELLPSTPKDQDQETFTLFHEIGHALGLKHEHVSPKTLTIGHTKDASDKLNYLIYTPFDDKSIMLYPGKLLQGSTVFDELLTDLNPTPSKQDFALLGVRLQLLLMTLSSSSALFRLYTLVSPVIGQISSSSRT